VDRAPHARTTRVWPCLPRMWSCCGHVYHACGHVVVLFTTHVVMLWSCLPRIWSCCGHAYHASCIFIFSKSMSEHTCINSLVYIHEQHGMWHVGENVRHSIMMHIPHCAIMALMMDDGMTMHVPPTYLSKTVCRARSLSSTSSIGFAITRELCT
jgi:hypothetical protein